MIGMSFLFKRIVCIIEILLKTFLIELSLLDIVCKLYNFFLFFLSRNIKASRHFFLAFNL